MGKFVGQGQPNYERRLNDCRAQDKVGINQHLYRPTPPDSRLGYKGKRPKNVTILAVEQAMRPVKDQPAIAKAYANVKALADQIKPPKQERKAKERKAQATEQTEVPKEVLNEIERLRIENAKLIEQTTPEPVKPVVAVKPIPQPPPLPPKEVKVERPKQIEVELTPERIEELREKHKQEELAKLAQKMKTEHFSKFWNSAKPGYSVG